VDLLLARRVPLRVIAGKFGLNASALCRHRQKHMSPTLKAALIADVPETELDLEKLRRDESEKLLQNLVAHRGRLWALVDAAEDSGDFRAAGQLHGKVIDIWRLEAEFLGELNAAALHVTQNITVQPQYLELRVALVQALGPFPEARRQVAGLLHSLESEAVVDAGEKPHPTA